MVSLERARRDIGERADPFTEEYTVKALVEMSVGARAPSVVTINRPEYDWLTSGREVRLQSLDRLIGKEYLGPPRLLGMSGLKGRLELVALSGALLGKVDPDQAPREIRRSRDQRQRGGGSQDCQRPTKTRRSPPDRRRHAHARKEAE